MSVAPPPFRPGSRTRPESIWVRFAYLTPFGALHGSTILYGPFVPSFRRRRMLGETQWRRWKRPKSRKLSVQFFCGQFVSSVLRFALSRIEQRRTKTTQTPQTCWLEKTPAALVLFILRKYVWGYLHASSCEYLWVSLCGRWPVSKSTVYKNPSASDH